MTTDSNQNWLDLTGSIVALVFCYAVTVGWVGLMIFLVPVTAFVGVRGPLPLSALLSMGLPPAICLLLSLAAVRVYRSPAIQALAAPTTLVNSLAIIGLICAACWR